MSKVWQDARNAVIENLEDDVAKPPAQKPKEKEKAIVLRAPIYRVRPEDREVPNWGMKAIHDF